MTLKSADHVAAILAIVNGGTWATDFIWTRNKDREETRTVSLPDKITNYGNGVYGVSKQSKEVLTGNKLYTDEADFWKSIPSHYPRFPTKAKHWKRESRFKQDGAIVRHFELFALRIKAVTVERDGVIEKITFYGTGNWDGECYPQFLLKEVEGDIIQGGIGEEIGKTLISAEEGKKRLKAAVMDVETEQTARGKVVKYESLVDAYYGQKARRKLKIAHKSDQELAERFLPTLETALVTNGFVWKHFGLNKTHKDVLAIFHHPATKMDVRVYVNDGCEKKVRFYIDSWASDCVFSSVHDVSESLYLDEADTAYIGVWLADINEQMLELYIDGKLTGKANHRWVKKLSSEEYIQ